EIRDEILAVAEALEGVARAVEDAGRVVEPLVEEVSPAHQADLAVQPEVGREQRPFRRREPHGPDSELVIRQGRHVSAEAHLKSVVEVEIQEGVEQVKAVQSPIDREDVFDRLGDPAVEEDALARKEEAADRGSLAAVGPYSSLDLLE